MIESVIETEYDLRNIGLIEISNLMEKGDTDISEGVLFFSRAHGVYNSVFYSIGRSSSKTDVLAIRPHRSLLFSLQDAAKCAEVRIPEGSKLLIVPLDDIALGELEQHFATAPKQVNGFEVQYRKTPLIAGDVNLDLQKKGPVFVGRCAFDPVENAKRAKELVKMRAHFTEVFSDPKYL